MRKRRPICTVLVITGILRVAVPAAAFLITSNVKIFHTPDTASFLRPALGLVSSGSFAVDGTPEILRTPGYPLLLVPGVLAGRLELTTIFLQIVLSTLTAYVVFEIALLMFSSEDVAVLCAMLYAVDPLSLLYSSLLMSEALFSFCVTVSLYLTLRFIVTLAWSDVLGAAAMLSASAYVRPIAYFLPVLFSIVLLVWLFLAKAQRRKRSIQVVMFFVVSASLIFAWQLRNYYSAGYHKFSAIQDYDMYFYAGASVLAQEKGLSLVDQQKLMGIYDWEAYFRKHPEQVAWKRGDVYAYMGREGLRLVASHPLEYLKSALKGPLTTLLGPGLTPWLTLFRSEPSSQRWAETTYNTLSASMLIQAMKKTSPVLFWGNAFLGGLLLTYWVLGLAALFSRRCISRENLAGVVMLLMVAAYFIIVPLNTGHSRFRHPAMPIICIFGGCGLSRVIAGAKRLLRARVVRSEP